MYGENAAELVPRLLDDNLVLQVHKRDSAGDRSRECICTFAGGLQITSAKVAVQRFVCLTADLPAVSGVYTLQRNSQLLERSVVVCLLFDILPYITRGNHFNKVQKMADSKSSIISALVSQMKTGQISKNDLFDQLSNLQRGSGNGSTEEGADVRADDGSTVEDPATQYDEAEEASAPRPVSMAEFMATRNTPSSRRGRTPESAQSLSTKSRQERRELEIKFEQMKECTFQPQIIELPNGYSANPSSPRSQEFHDRMTKWKQKKEQQLRRERDRKEQEKMDNCTFRPKINQASRRTAALGQRDYKDVVERLYSNNKKSRVNEDDIRAKREEEFRRTCTFRPNLGKEKRSPDGSRFRPNRRSASAGRSRRSEFKPTGMDECTFKPKVNAVPRKFGSAQLYLQNNVHDRLSTPRAPKGRDEGSPNKGGYMSDDEVASKAKPIMNMDSFMSSLNAKTGRTQSGRPSSARKSRPGEKVLNQAQFQNFLARQNKRESRKAKNMARLSKESAPSHQPNLCKKSISIASRTCHGDFMARLAKDALKKEHDILRKKAMLAKEPDCTFTPQILASSKARRGRSVTELSRGDSLKRETAARLMKLKAEQDELNGLTFQPMLNPSNAQGKLKILSNPDSYLERVQKEQEIFSDRRRKAAQEQERKQFAECTFAPKTNDAPAYIRRIAKSMALAKKARPSSSENGMSRPDWK